MIANYNKAINESEKIIEQFDITAPPVPLDTIVTGYGLDIVYADFSKIPRGNEIAGFIDFEQKKIVVNKSDPPNRQRFTIAHELGHFLLHQDYVQNRSKYKVLLRRPIKEQGYSPEEQEANCFAAHLLVPNKMIDKYRNVPSNISSSIFAVSEEVFKYSIQRKDSFNVGES